MSKIKRIYLPEEGEIHTYVCAFDWHTEALDAGTYSVFKQFLKTIPREQRRVVIGGDFLDCPHLMAKDTAFKKWAKCIYTIEEDLIPKTERELDWGNKILDELQELCDYIYFIEGNHDWRYRKWMEFCPIAYRHNFDYRERLKLQERGILFVQYNDYLDIGNLTITHGFKHGANHTKQTYLATTRSILYGHVHHLQVNSFFHRGIPKRAVSSPCMCDLNPEYTKKWGEKNWSNGFVSVNMKSNGNFNLHVHDIWDNELILPNGKILNGKKES